MRGEIDQRDCGVGTASLYRTGFKLASRTVALITPFSSILRCSTLKLNDIFFEMIGPLMLPSKNMERKSGLSPVMNGFLALNTLSLAISMNWPRTLSVPGRVRISIRPKPRRSYSAENGFELMRISRMFALGG